MKNIILVLIVCIGISINSTKAEVYNVHADAWYAGQTDYHNNSSIRWVIPYYRTYFVYLDAYTTANSTGHSRASAYIYQDTSNTIEYNLESTGSNSHPADIYVSVTAWANSVAVVAEAVTPSSGIYSYASASIRW